MTAPLRRPLTANQAAVLVFSAVVLLCMLCVVESRDWMAEKFSDLVLATFGWLGADTGPLTT